MCRIDFDHHLEGDMNGTKIYAEIEDLLEAHDCARECGIVKVSVTITEVVEKGALY